MTESESDHEKNDVQGAEWGQDVVSDERSPNNESKPLFSFGAIADVQHADIEDGWNWHKTRRRYYRGGLLQLKLAVDTWLTDENHSFAIQLGDVIDGCNADEGRSEEAMRNVTKELDRLSYVLPLGVLSSLGNHELYNFSKHRWAREVDCSSRGKAVTLRPPLPPSAVCSSLPPLKAFRNGDGIALRIPEEDDVDSVAPETEERFYYSFCPDPAWRFIALDTYDVNAIRDEVPRPRRHDEEASASEEWDQTDKQRVPKASEMLEGLNPNSDKNDHSGMQGLSKRFVEYNGGIGDEQLLWLENELQQASEAGQQVITFGHVPIHPDNGSTNCLLWNFKEVLEVMHKFNCVVMCLSGHRHHETYVKDQHGTHHLSLAAALEAPPEEGAFASVDVYPHHLDLRGHGVVENRALSF